MLGRLVKQKALTSQVKFKRRNKHQPNDTTIEIKQLEEILEDSLKNIHEPVRQCCIYKVPKDLRNIDKQAYTPQTISIGPFHHGKGMLSEMEDQKLNYMSEFLKRVGAEKLKEFKSFIKENEKDIRNHYQENSSLVSPVFVNMILRDAVFIIEFFLRNAEKREFDFFLDTPCMKAAIIRDLQLLENQLPYFLLKNLFEKADFQKFTEELKKKYPDSDPFLILSHRFFFNPKDGVFPEPKNEIQHFTDLIRYFLLMDLLQQDQKQGEHVRDSPTAGDQKQEEHVRDSPTAGDQKQGEHVKVLTTAGDQKQGEHVRDSPTAGDQKQGEHARDSTIAGDQKQGEHVRDSTTAGDQKQGEHVRDPHTARDHKQGKHLRGLPTATKLHGSGVKFEKGIEGGSSLKITCDYVPRTIRIPYFKSCQLPFQYFKACEVRIPRLEIDDWSECLYRNLMALELCLYPSETHICNFILMMNFLIDTEKDVDLLVDQKIIFSSLGDNATVATMFNSLGLQITPSPSVYHDICKKLKAHYDKRWNRTMANLNTIYFGDIWKGTATVAAVILLVLTFAQTIFSVLSLV